MRNWGIVVTVFYALTVLGLVVCALFLAVGDVAGVREVYTAWFCWIPIGIVVSGQALLLFLSVDTSRKRLRPRAHILDDSSFNK